MRSQPLSTAEKTRFITRTVPSGGSHTCHLFSRALSDHPRAKISPLSLSRPNPSGSRFEALSPCLTRRCRWPVASLAITGLHLLPCRRRSHRHQSSSPFIFFHPSSQGSPSACISVLGAPQSRKVGSVGTPRSLTLHLNFSTRNPFRQIQMESGPYHKPRGALIVLEGLDRCGKTSQSSRLVSYLEGKGFSVESWRFPDRNTGVGEMISSYLSNKSQLDDRAIHLLFSANRWEKRLLMESKLKSGTTLVVDRYSYSGVAFSAAKGLDIEWCKAPEIGLLAPDLVIYLEMPPEKAAERGGYGNERYEKLDFQKKVARHYDFLRDETWKSVDACLPMEDVEKQLQEIVLDTLTACQKGKPFSHLWMRKQVSPKIM